MVRCPRPDTNGVAAVRVDLSLGRFGDNPEFVVGDEFSERNTVGALVVIGEDKESTFSPSIRYTLFEETQSSFRGRCRDTAVKGVDYMVVAVRPIFDTTVHIVQFMDLVDPARNAGRLDKQLNATPFGDVSLRVLSASQHFLFGSSISHLVVSLGQRWCPLFRRLQSQSGNRQVDTSEYPVKSLLDFCSRKIAACSWANFVSNGPGLMTASEKGDILGFLRLGVRIFQLHLLRQALPFPDHRRVSLPDPCHGILVP